MMSDRKIAKPTTAEVDGRTADADNTILQEIII
jgi:hypothetical protein